MAEVQAKELIALLAFPLHLGFTSKSAAPSTTDNPTPGTIRRPRPSTWPRRRSSRPFHVACLFVNGLALGMVFGLVPGIWIGCKSGVIEERMAAIHIGPLPNRYFLWRRS
jgi:hypothetical protein